MQPSVTAKIAAATIAALGLTLVTGYGSARADQAPSVARLSRIQGTVTIGNDTTSLTEAEVNMPVLPGEYVNTTSASRAEVQLDWADAIRARSNTQLRFTNLDGLADTAQLAAGTVELRVLKGSSDVPLIETPSVTVKPNGPGGYLVSVEPDGSTQVTVRSGDAQIITPGGTQDLQPGRTMLASGNANDPEFTYIANAPYDGFEQWNDDLDRQLAQTSAYQYVNQDVIGANDLNAYGSWNYVPGYGQCWQPNEGPDWAPYQNGTWITNNYYGPTWVGYVPWGWAPYHYGRWFNRPQIGWAWDPGSRPVHPLWSPALVGFIGFNAGGVHAIVGLGNVGWIPLAPGEAYRPWYGPRYHTTIINNNYTTIVNANTGWQRHYANFRAPHAISAVTLDNWNHGRIQHVVSFDARQIRTARMVPGAPRFVSSPARTFENARGITPVARPVTTRATSHAPAWHTFDGARTEAPQQARAQQVRMRHFGHTTIAPPHQTALHTNPYQHAQPYSTGTQRSNATRAYPTRAYPTRPQPAQQTSRPAPQRTYRAAPQRTEQRKTSERPNVRPTHLPLAG